MKILYAEDSGELQTLITEFLEISVPGIKITKARDGKEALEKYSPDFDLVLTDYQMPHHSGEFLAKALRALNYTKPIILFTGSSNLVEDISLFDCILEKSAPHALIDEIRQRAI